MQGNRFQQSDRCQEHFLLVNSSKKQSIHMLHKYVFYQHWKLAEAIRSVQSRYIKYRNLLAVWHFLQTYKPLFLVETVFRDFSPEAGYQLSFLSKSLKPLFYFNILNYYFFFFL